MATDCNAKLKGQIEKVIKKNTWLTKEFSIGSIDEFRKALGDRYDSKIRDAIMSGLSAKERSLVREYYLRNCNAGMDRFPACIKITIEWEHRDVWIPKDSDYITEMRSEYDRIKSVVKISCKTRAGMSTKIQSIMDETFEDEFFSFAENALWEERNDAEESYLIDANPMYVRCEFSDGTVRESKGKYPLYYPYDKLNDMGQEYWKKCIVPVLGRL